MQLTSPVEALTTAGPQHPTAGLPGYPAHDWFAPAGTRVLAPAAGAIERLSGHDPSGGPIPGAAGVYGWSVYLRGDDGHTYYLTHLATRSVTVGQKVHRGQPIGTVAPWHLYGRPDHIHQGVH